VRLIVSWNPQTKCFDYLLTNLPKSRYTISMICLGYKLRWQVEIYQSCNLRRTLFWPKIDFFGFHDLQLEKILDNEPSTGSIGAMTAPFSPAAPASSHSHASCHDLVFTLPLACQTDTVWIPGFTS
jgi:hypothetical protein